MGLDIVTLKHPRYEGPLKDENGNWRDPNAEAQDGGYVKAVYGDDFPYHLDGRRQGFYEGEEGISFRAGSYSSYNAVRAALSQLALGVGPEAVWADPSAYVGRPLFELVNFSDCDGAIGPETSRRLADALDELAPRFSEMADYYASTAEYFRRAFREAADSDGFVIFT